MESSDSFVDIHYYFAKKSYLKPHYIHSDLSHSDVYAIFPFFYLLYIKIIILITLLHFYNITNTYMTNMLFMSTSSFSHEIWSSQAHRGADNYNVFIMVLSKYIEDAERKKPYRLSTQNTLANGFF